MKFVLRIKLKHLDQWNSHRKAIADAYQSRLQNVGDLVLPFTTNGASHVFHVYTLRSAKRDELQKQLLSKGIHTMIHYPVPPHLQKAFAHLNYKMGDFPIVEELATTSLSLPIWPGLEISQIDFICEEIEGFFKRNHL